MTPTAKKTGPDPDSLLAWQILAPVGALFFVLLLVFGLAARHFFEPLAIQRDLLRAERYAKTAAVVFSERLPDKTSRELLEEFWAAGLDTVEFLSPGEVPLWPSPRYLPAGPYVEAWAPVKNGEGSLVGAVSLRRQADAAIFVTRTILAFAAAACVAFALLATLFWILLKRRVTDRLAAIVRQLEVSPAEPMPHSGADAIEQARAAVANACARTAKDAAALRRLAEGHGELACIATAEGRILDVNEAYCRYFGQKRDEAIGSNYLDLVQPAYRMDVLGHLRSLCSSKPEATIDHGVTKLDGTTAWIRWRDRAVIGPDGNVQEIISFGTDITAEKRLQDELLAVRRAFDQMQSLAQTGSITWDFSRHRMAWTPETRRLLGVDASATASMESLLAAVAPDERNRLRELFDAAREEGRAFECEFQAVLPDGSMRVLQGRAEVLADPKSKLLNHLTCTLHDITALRDAEAATKRELRFREAIEQSMGVGIVVSDEKGRNLLVNPAFARMTGWSQKELVGIAAPYPYWPEEEIPAIKKAFEQAIAGKTPDGGFELRFCRKDGTRFDVLVKVAPLLDSNDRQLGWLGAVTDISSLQDIRRGLQQAESSMRRELLYRQAIEQSLDIGIVLRDMSGKTVSVNPAFVKMVGFSEEELLAAQPPNEPYWPAEEKTNITKALGEALAGRPMPEGFQMVFQRRDGLRFDVLVKVAPLLDSNGKQLGWLGAVSDVSTIQQTRRALSEVESQLRQQLNYLQAIEKSVTVGLIAIGTDGRPLSVNDAYCRMLGYSRDEMMAMSPPYPLWPEEDREEIQQAFDLHLKGKGPEGGFQLRFKKKDGSLIDVLITVSDLLGEDGSSIGVLSSLANISPLKDAERRLAVANERLQIAQDVAAFGIWDWDPVADTLYWDAISFAMFGHPEATDAQAVWKKAHSEEEQERLTYQLRRLIKAGGASGQDRLSVQWPDGSRHEISSTYVIIRNPEGKATRVIGVNRDITDELEEERELRNAQERLAAALEIGEFGTFEHVFGVGAINWNAVNYEIHGIDTSITDPDELFRAWKSAVGPDYQAIEQVVSGLPVEKNSITYDFSVRVPGSGASRRVRSSVFVERDSDGLPVRLVGVSHRID